MLGTIVIIKEFIARSRKFTIVLNEQKYYCAIEDKYITDGKINQELNGLQMYCDRDLNACLDHVRDAVEMDYLMSQGVSKAEAFCTVFNMMDKLDTIKSLFDEKDEA